MGVASSLRRLGSDRNGVAAIEFALALPVLVVLVGGLVEFGRLALVVQKLQNGAFILSDLAARDRTLGEDDLENIFLAVDSVVQPFDLAGLGSTMVSAVVVDDDGDAEISWQRTGAGSLDADSAIGAEGQAPELPEALDPQSGETIIVAEVFYSFSPLFSFIAEPWIIHKVAYVKPRLGTLATLEP